MERNEELINHIKGYLDNGMDKYEHCYFHKEDLEIIIKALEQEPCEDCISRELVINYLISEWYKELRDIIQDIRQFPSVTPQEPKTGHWIDYDSNVDSYDKIRCSECGRSFIVDSYHWCDIGFTKDDLEYCPSCGARMEKEG